MMSERLGNNTTFETWKVMGKIDILAEETDGSIRVVMPP